MSLKITICKLCGKERERERENLCVSVTRRHRRSDVGGRRWGRGMMDFDSGSGSLKFVDFDGG